MSQREESMRRTARLTAEVQGLDGMSAELLRWRKHAHALGSPALRTRMQEELAVTFALYASAL